MGSSLKRLQGWGKGWSDMSIAVKAGGCERCGRTEGVTYKGWQFLCKVCRAGLQQERAQQIVRSRLMASLEWLEARRYASTG